MVVYLIIRNENKKKRIEIQSLEQRPGEDILLQINKQLAQEVFERDEQIKKLTGEKVLLQRKLNEQLI